jgi:hypothetical protein
VVQVSPEFALPKLQNDFEQLREHWKLAFTVVDYRGQRDKPQIPAFDITFRLIPADQEDEVGAPKCEMDIGWTSKPTIVSKSGWLANWM